MWDNFFGRVKIVTIAKDELYEAQKALLLAQSQLEFAEASVATNTCRVQRLKEFVAKEEAEAKAVKAAEDKARQDSRVLRIPPAPPRPPGFGTWSSGQPVPDPTPTSKDVD